MKIAKVFVAGFLLACLLPAVSHSGVRISLNNGREIIADSCRESGGKLICSMSGGVVEILKSEIKNISDIKSGSGLGIIESADIPASDAEKKSPEKQQAGNKPAGSANNGKTVGGLNPQQTKRLDEITERKTVLKPEREMLIKEQEQLFQDVKSKTIIRTQSEYDAIKSRISDLEAKIKGFNEEVKKLNEEEKAIIDAAGAK